MPYVKLSDKSKPRPDRLKAILLERMKSEGKTQKNVADYIGISLSKFKLLLKKHTDFWEIGELILALRAVDVRLTLNTSNYDFNTN